jgi:adenosylcobinamide kinase / adenosylcobinamide-phosphate guanylyltransferase
MGETILVLGGSRSGKSGLASRLAGESLPVTFVATAVVDSGDAEMTARVARHRAERPAEWTRREIPRNLEAILPNFADVQGLANPWLAAACDVVHLRIAGLSLRLK